MRARRCCSPDGETTSAGRCSPATAVAIAVGVAASRVLLDVHWLSDVVAGIVLGWAWFAVCSIAFGGRLLHFGAPAETVIEEARSASPGTETARARRPCRAPEHARLVAPGGGS